MPKAGQPYEGTAPMIGARSGRAGTRRRARSVTSTWSTPSASPATSTDAEPSERVANSALVGAGAALPR